MTPPNTLRCGVYTRKSHEEGLDQEFNSLHAQREACEAYVKSQAGEGWELIDTPYDDGGFSGASMERPGLKRLLADIHGGQIDIVVVYKVDRLTRSLTDFARIVESFESHGVSFVSVTQAFKTTTSIGRLTLNVLLSFAQFEREVIGERIRDKIAASKKKGIWMGGVPPLGYDVNERKLVANPAEAERVRFIYQRYLELGSVPELVADLKARGVHTKTWITQKGVERRGAFFGRGALYTLLRNPVYLGRIVHRGKTYPGTHEPIVDKALWDRVQALLASHRGKRSEAATSKPTNLLAGLLFDDRGNLMAPSHATKRGGRRYRYYVSGALLKRNPAAAGSIARVPAQAIEELVKERVRDLLQAPCRDDWESMPPVEQMCHLRGTLRRVNLRAQEVELVFSKAALDPQATNPARTPLADLIPGDGDTLILRIPIRLKTWGGEKLIHAPRDESPNNGGRPDKALIKALARAFTWREALEKGKVRSLSDLARANGCKDDHYIRRILKLAFLAPDIVEAILQGSQPQEITLSRILQVNLPLSWQEQREVLGFFSDSRV